MVYNSYEPNLKTMNLQTPQTLRKIFLINKEVNDMQKFLSFIKQDEDVEIYTSTKRKCMTKTARNIAEEFNKDFRNKPPLDLKTDQISEDYLKYFNFY